MAQLNYNLALEQSAIREFFISDCREEINQFSSERKKIVFSKIIKYLKFDNNEEEKI